MSDVTLSPGVRSNLLQLQASANLIVSAQTRLASGRRVNSALDNPNNFFTAQKLNSRVSDLNALLDQMGQTQQRLQATGDGVIAAMKLLAAAKSIAEQAKLAPRAAAFSQASAVGTTDVTPPPATIVTSSKVVGGGIFGNGLVIRVGGVPYSIPTPLWPTIDDAINTINTTTGLGPGGAATASKDGSGQHLVLTSNSAQPITVDLSDAATNTGLLDPNLVQVVPGLSGTDLTVQTDDYPARTVTFGTGPGEIQTVSDLQSAVGFPAQVGLSGNPLHLEISAWGTVTPFFAGPPGSKGSVTLAGSALAPLGLAATTQSGSLAGTPDPTRAALARQFGEILNQIDTLVADASYGGIDFLVGDDLNLPLNETGTSSLSIKGADSSSPALGLSINPSDGLQTNGDVDAYISRIDRALVTLRTRAAQFGSTLTVVQARQNFTKAMINTLQSGADSLTLADSNEDGANLLALQTRQQLSTTALSLAAQSDQSILRLFQ